MIKIAKFQDKINKHYPNEQLTVLEYKGARDSCIIRCETCGKEYSYAWSGTLLSSKKKILCHSCQDRIAQRRLFEQRLKERFPQDSLELMSFISRKKPCDIRCKVCGELYHFEAGDYALNKTRDFFCKKCYPFKISIMQDTLKRFEDFINNSSDWELIQNLKDVHAHSLVECKCLHCGRTNKKTVYDYLRGRGCFCQSNTEQKTTEQFKEELDDDYELLDEYKDAYTKVTLRHKTCGFIYKVSPHNYLTGKRCPRCSRVESKGERKIREFFDNHNLAYIQEYPVEIEGHHLRFDFYLKELDLFIEYQGRQHYEPIDYFGGKDRFNIQKEYDQIKRDFAKDKLIEIKYDEDVIAILTNTLKLNDYPLQE